MAIVVAPDNIESRAALESCDSFLSTPEAIEALDYVQSQAVVAAVLASQAAAENIGRR